MKYVFPEEKVFIRPEEYRLRYPDKVDPNIYKRWSDQGLIRKLRNGLYLNNSWKESCEVDRFVVANNLYEPSYVSLYTALYYYALIPELVVEVESITTRKTKSFELDGRRYKYRKIRPDMFFGMTTVPWNESTYTVAEPEKAILDLVYLEPRFDDRDWIEELRLDPFGIKEDLNWDKMFLYAHRIDSKVVNHRIANILEVLER